MFTRKRLDPFKSSGNWAADGERLVKWINDYWLSLEGKDALAIDSASIRAANGIVFPSTQNSSTDANTLDDYEEVTNLSIASSVASTAGTITTVGTSTISYTKFGRQLDWQADITITTNGTGSGKISFTFPLSVQGFPPLHGDNSGGVALTGNITGTSVAITFYDGTYPGGDGARILVGGTAYV